MKLLLSVVGLLLVSILPVLCWPANENANQQPRAGVKHWDDILKEMQEKNHQEPLVAETPSKKAPLLATSAPSRVPGEYIVVFENYVTDEDVSSHLQAVTNMINSYGTEANVMKDDFQIGKFRGYSAKMNDNLRDHVRAMEKVKYVEHVQRYYATEIQATCLNELGATWGLVRTSYRDTPTSQCYTYESDAGEDVDVYIIDTGIDTSHPDFGGRAEWGADFIDNPSPETDFDGHGTHVAGTVMADTWGIAKRATAIAVRVLGPNGGTTGGVIGGIEYVVRRYLTYGRKTVANMSLGGGRSQALNDAVDSAAYEGVHFAVAAGNEGQDACNVSPASAYDCVTVGASDERDQFAWFSNYGECVSIIAPGVDITSTWLNGNTNTISGTSMASPHVAGVMARYLSSLDYNPHPFILAYYMIITASSNKIGGIPDPYTPNRLLYKDCTES